MQSLNWPGLVGGVVLTALLLAVGHWFPWLHRERKLRNYAYGTASIIAGFALWRLLAGDVVSVAGLLIIAGAGGLVVIVAYWIDDRARELRQAQMAARADDELSE